MDCIALLGGNGTGKGASVPGSGTLAPSVCAFPFLLRFRLCESFVRNHLPLWGDGPQSSGWGPRFTKRKFDLETPTPAPAISPRFVFYEQVHLKAVWGQAARPPGFSSLFLTRHLAGWTRFICWLIITLGVWTWRRINPDCDSGCDSKVLEYRARSFGSTCNLNPGFPTISRRRISEHCVFLPVQVPPAESEKETPSKIRLNFPNFRLSRQISIAEIGDEGIRNFKLCGISDYSDEVRPTCNGGNPRDRNTCWENKQNANRIKWQK